MADRVAYPLTATREMLRSLILTAAISLAFTGVGRAEKLDAARVCASAQVPGFAVRMDYMASGGEGCDAASCLDRRVVLGRRAYLEVALDPRHPSFVPLAAPVAGEAAAIVADTIGVDFGAGFDDADSFLFFVVVSASIEDRILKGELEGIDRDLFRTFVLPALRARRCSGIATHIGNGSSRLMHHAVTFVPEAIITDAEKVRACILEELMNATGLLRDPPGSASLFDSGNFRLVDGKLTYSDETLAMLKLHYDFARGVYRDVDDFLSSQCEVPPE